MPHKRTSCHPHAAVLLLLTALLGGCGAKPDSSATATATIRVVAPFPPQACFAEQVGGSFAEVTTLVSSGVCSETYQITPKQINALTRAQVYLRAGMPFENVLISKIADTSPQLRILDLRNASSNAHPAHEEPHHHEEAGSHHHAEADPHSWLDPLCVIQQVRRIAEQFSEIDPAHQSEFSTNAEAFIREVAAVHENIAVMMAPLQGKTLYVFHPAFGHFAARYGLKQVSLEREGKPPGQHYLKKVIAAMKQDGARSVFVEPKNADPALKAVTEAAGVKAVPLDPLNHAYLHNLESMAKAIVEGLS